MAELCCSDNDEMFYEVCDDLEGAIEIAHDNGWDSLYVGTKVAVKWSDFLPPMTNDDFWQGLSENSFNRGGEAAEGWPDPNEEQVGDLNRCLRAAVDAWADRNGLQPKFWLVENVKSHHVPPCEDD